MKVANFLDKGVKLKFYTAIRRTLLCTLSQKSYQFCVACKQHFVKYEKSLFLGHAVAQLVEALRYKLEDRGFDSRLCDWNSSLT